jgi:signal transduction histidine kinase
LVCALTNSYAHAKPVYWASGSGLRQRGSDVSVRINGERDRTDESLRIERQKTDQALVDKQATVDQRADQTVEEARSAADAVVATARVTADELLTGGDEQVLAPTALAEQRAAEDEALEGVRADADEALRRQREEDFRALAALLPLERQKTDRYLLTERARADDAVTHRDDFLGIVSHDLRDLLSGIVLSAAMLPDSAADKTSGTKQRIQRYAARMNRLIGDLVDVAAIDAGKLSVVPAPGDWCALVEEVTALFQPSATAQGIRLGATLAARPLAMQFDHDRMLQVLANLIANSLKFTPRGGTIRVEADRDAHELRCAVCDTGSGIPRAMHEAIFQRFWQGRANDRRGVGLGLYITRCIVEAHGGRIWADSTQGTGTTLRFTLPIT